MVFSSYPEQEIQERIDAGKPGTAPGVFLRQIGVEYHVLNFDGKPCDLDGKVEGKELTLEDIAAEKAALAEKMKALQAAEKALAKVEKPEEKRPETPQS